MIKPLNFSVVNNKHKTEYLVEGFRLNATNAQNRQVLVNYTNCKGAYARESGEFLEKFSFVNDREEGAFLSALADFVKAHR